MKKIMIALLVTVGLTAPASANHLAHFFAGKTYKNRGQCQAALMAERNNRRNNDGNTGSFSDPDYNHAVHNNYSCVQNANGDWEVQPQA